MFNFFRRSKSKNGAKQTRFERMLTRFFSSTAELPQETQENIKKRVLNRIQVMKEERKNAELLDRSIAGEKVQNSAGAVDFLAAIAESLLNLPKTLPNTLWRESARGNFGQKRSFSFFSILRQATALAMLVVVVGGIALTSFISQTRTVVAQLSVESGVVRIKEANSPFFVAVDSIATIRLGDTIRVEMDSAAQLAFYDASKMYLTESTEVAITEFDPDYITREKSEVKVAVLSGSVEAEVAKENSSFEIETPTGSVAAQNAKFSVAVNPETGSTKIAASEDVVAVKSTTDTEAVALVAGQAIVFADEASELLISKAAEEVATEEVVAELPAIETIATDIDFIQIRTFDALIAAQKDEMIVAGKIRNGIQEKLDTLLADLGLGELEGSELEALEIFVRKNYLAGPQRDATLTHLKRTEKLSSILNYYFVAPQFLTGVPEFEILADSRYEPSGKLRNLFAVLQAKRLAHTEIHVTIDELVAQMTIELAEDLRRQNTANQLAQLLERMDDQPVFLAVLQKLSPMIPSESRAAIDHTIQAMESVVEGYVGS